MADSPTPDVSLREKAQYVCINADADCPAYFQCIGPDEDHCSNCRYVAELERELAALRSRVERAEADSKRLAALWRAVEDNKGVTINITEALAVEIDELCIDVGAHDSFTQLLDAIGEYHAEIDWHGCSNDDCGREYCHEGECDTARLAPTPEAPGAL